MSLEREIKVHTFEFNSISRGRAGGGEGPEWRILCDGISYIFISCNCMQNKTLTNLYSLYTPHSSLINCTPLH